MATQSEDFTTLFLGPVFQRELAITPRRPRLYIYRAVYAAGLMILISSAWLLLAGAQVIRNVGDMARFGSVLFQIIAPLQLALVSFFAAMSAASAVAQEKDKRTLILLLMTRMTNNELVSGKLFASILNVLVMIATSLPIFMLMVLFGGISFVQVARVFAVTLTTVFAAGALGALLAFWREKTFQTLALTTLTLCFWLGLWEVVGAGFLGESWLGISTETWATGFSPLRAILVAARPFLPLQSAVPIVGNGVYLYLASSTAIAFLLSVIAILRVRIWNPSREVRVRATDSEQAGASIWGAEHDLASEQTGEQAEEARSGHVDARLRAETSTEQTREVWDNPILWRELKTWAYGKKVIFIRVAYLALFVMAALAVHFAIESQNAASYASYASDIIPATARPMAPLFLVSLIIVNALAVTSVSTERDGQSLDLLLATDLSPHEFVFGKLGGVFSVGGMMVVAPLLLTGYLWFRGGMSLENLIYTTIGLIVMNFFVATLGVHCGMRYANSRNAIGVSLGTVFFLFLGVIACMAMMILLSSSFEMQMAPFLGFIVGGGIGLYVSLGAGNPSKAIGAASILAPFATFYAITSFLMDKNLSVFLVTVCTYGFTTAAMLIPALYEFDFAMGGRAANAEE